MGIGELKELVHEWAERQKQANKLACGPTSRKFTNKGRMVKSLMEIERDTHTFDINVTNRKVTRICPLLSEEFPFIFDTIKVGMDVREFRLVYDLTTVNKYREVFKKMMDKEFNGNVIYCHMEYEDVNYVLKMWRYDVETVRTMYIKELQKNGVGRLLMEGVVRVTHS